MRSPLLTRRRATAGLVSATLLFTACGASDEGTDVTADDALPAVDDVPASESGEVSDPGATTPAPEGSVMIDLVGADVLPAADVASNALPDVVVDDLNTGRKVNFRNLVPQDKPVLLWMWAPH